MEVKAVSKFLKISPRKLRLLADSLKRLSAVEAVAMLKFVKKSASQPLRKTIESAIANATNNLKLPKENLRIKSLEVGEGGSFKRFRPSGRGRIHPYKKRMSHIKIILEEANGAKS
ncbi:50S ribosomal protein L22 [Candidatus Microgenomates bacterium]|nr:50S ribosomal protein L22 [Candidatus Microgenomates bacterium]MBI2622171.1 50S ribosomal protein L22 [Candidatus Microgenomates bacterium]